MSKELISISELAVNFFKTRIIVKLEVKSNHVVKPIYFEGLRRVGTPGEMLQKYFSDGADELIYIDIVASLYQRGIDYEQIKKASEGLYIPLTVGGGIRSVDDCSRLFDSGADKVCINTHALQSDSMLINNAVKIFGSQAVVINIEAKSIEDTWTCYSDNGRIPSFKDVVEWVAEVEDRGAGEIILQSVDRDGSRKGFDFNLISKVMERSQVPVIISSGAGDINHIVDVVKEFNPHGIALSSVLHYNDLDITLIKERIHNELT